MFYRNFFSLFYNGNIFLIVKEDECSIKKKIEIFMYERRYKKF